VSGDSIIDRDHSILRFSKRYFQLNPFIPFSDNVYIHIPCFILLLAKLPMMKKPV
jgi:hypothetical protein